MAEAMEQNQRAPRPLARTADSSICDELPEGKEYDVGILHVHGMGQQRRGETLTAAGDALVNWLERWIVGAVAAEQGGNNQPRRTRPYVRVLSPDGQVVRPEAGEAPKVELEVEVPDTDGRLTRSHWLMAESWWAEQFEPATFRGLLEWGFGVLPYVIISHFAMLISRFAGFTRRNPFWAFAFLPVGAGFLVLTAALTTLLLLVFVLLLLLELLPIPGTGAVVRRVQQLLANYLGDSQVLLNSPIGREAIVRTVRHDIEKLMRCCRSVIVVAHSQGGAVAHMALRTDYGGFLPEWRSAGRKVVLFTYGSGLGKLEQTGRNAAMWDRPDAISSAEAALGVIGVLTTGLYLLNVNLVGVNWLHVWVPLGVVIVGLIVLLSQVVDGPGLQRIIRLRALVASALTHPFSPALALLALLVGLPLIVGLPENLRTLPLFWVALPFWVALTAGAVFGRLMRHRKLHHHIEKGPLSAHGLSPEQQAKKRVEEQGFEDYAAALRPDSAFGEPVPWYDYYASLDIVPNGSLTNDPAKYCKLGMARSAMVYNQSSLIADHNAYWLNLDGFVGAVAMAAAELDPRLGAAAPAGRRIARLQPLDGVRLEAARCRRYLRARALIDSRWLILLMFSMLAWRLYGTLDATTLARWLRGEAEADGLVGWMIQLPLIAPLVGLAIPAVITVFITMTVSAIWRLWEWGDVKDLFERKPYTTTFLRLFVLNCLLWFELVLFIMMHPAFCPPVQPGDALGCGSIATVDELLMAAGTFGQITLLPVLAVPFLIPLGYLLRGFYHWASEKWIWRNAARYGEHYRRLAEEARADRWRLFVIGFEVMVLFGMPALLYVTFAVGFDLWSWQVLVAVGPPLLIYAAFRSRLIIELDKRYGSSDLFLLLERWLRPEDHTVVKELLETTGAYRDALETARDTANREGATVAEIKAALKGYPNVQHHVDAVWEASRGDHLAQAHRLLCRYIERYDAVEKKVRRTQQAAPAIVPAGD